MTSERDLDHDESRKLLRMAEDALRRAKGVERWVLGTLNNDPTRSGHHAWVGAKDTVKRLAEIVKQLTPNGE